jgi:hypothetical protein
MPWRRMREWRYISTFLDLVTRWMDDKWKYIWKDKKEMVVTCLRYYPDICLEGLMKTMYKSLDSWNFWPRFEPSTCRRQVWSISFIVTYSVIVKLWRKERSGEDKKEELKEQEVRRIGRKKLFCWRTSMCFWNLFLCSFYEFQFFNTC